MGFGVGSGAPIYLPDDYISREEQIASAAMFGGIFAGGITIGAAIAAVPEIAAAAPEIAFYLHQILSNPKVQTVMSTANVAGTAATCAMSAGPDCAQAVMGLPGIPGSGVADDATVLLGKLEAHIAHGVNLIKAGNYSAAISHLTDPKTATSLGIVMGAHPDLTTSWTRLPRDREVDMIVHQIAGASDQDIAPFWRINIGRYEGPYHP
jgi:hypothetical protein